MAREFSGTSQYLLRTDPTGLNPNAAWTFGCWLWVDGYGTDGRGILRVGGPEGGAITRGVYIYVRNSGVIRAIVGTDIQGVTAFGTGAWKKLVITRSGSGTSGMSIYLDGSATADASYATDAPGALASGDVLKLGDSSSSIGAALLDGRIAAPFWLQGVELSGTDAAAYLSDACSLITDFGAGGAVTPDALKFLFLLQSGAPGTDISGVGNDLTDTSTTDVADPAGVPTSCGAPPFYLASLYRWNGSAWVAPGILKRWNGSAWVPHTMKIYQP